MTTPPTTSLGFHISLPFLTGMIPPRRPCETRPMCDAARALQSNPELCLDVARFFTKEAVDTSAAILMSHIQRVKVAEFRQNV